MSSSDSTVKSVIVKSKDFLQKYNNISRTIRPLDSTSPIDDTNKLASTVSLSDLNVELSPEQLSAFRLFQKGCNLFISGPGGTGKSFLIKLFHQTATKPIQITSTTGCSAILLSEAIGRNCVKTINSWSGIRICRGTKDKIIETVLRNKYAVKEWKKTQILVIDEVSMLCAKMFDLLDTIGRCARNRNVPFGGIQIICLGDLYQLPPVPEQGDAETSMFCFESPTWFETFPIQQHIELKTIFRQKDETFKTILNEIRVGKLSMENSEILKQYVNRSYEDDSGIIPMKLLPTRSQVNFINISEYEKVKEPVFTYRQYISTSTNVEDSLYKFNKLSPKQQEMEVLNLKNTLPAEEEVNLKKGVPVMCLVNLDLEAGISNGSMGVIVDFVPTVTNMPDITHIPIVKFANGVIRPIGPYIWQHYEYLNISITQIPLRLSYSSTIHKLQGSTLDLAEINLGESIFAEGQIYVGLSRMKSLDGLYLTAFDPQRIKVNKRVEDFYNTIQGSK